MQCPLALWYKKRRKDLKQPVTAEQQALFDQGHIIGNYAHSYFPGGAEVNAPFWSIERGIEQTQDFVIEGFDTIYEACAIASNGCHARIDILHRAPNAPMSSGMSMPSNDSIEHAPSTFTQHNHSNIVSSSKHSTIPSSKLWKLIEVKASTTVKPYQLVDLAFQYYVFVQAGYTIASCHLLLVDKLYRRNGDVVPTQLLQLHDVTEQVKVQARLVGARAQSLQRMLANSDPPQVSIGERCTVPFECPYMHTCWKGVPKYSIFNVFSGEVANKLYATYGANLRDIPPDVWKNSDKALDISCYINNTTHINRDELSKFLNKLVYPLFFLDYETISSAVPLFDGTSPYQQIPFQFSLHVMPEPGAPLLHREFLHTEQTDPRKHFVPALIEQCKNEGSIIVYYKEFEKGVTTRLIEFAPHYESQLNAICNRMVDLLVPFRRRGLYHPLQNGSASIKSTLPAFTDLSYKQLEIQEGGTASINYLHFMTGILDKSDHQRLFENLRQYCALDTLAMVELLSVIEKYNSPTPPLF